VPQACRCPIAYAGDQPSQDRDARQQDLALNQPSGGQIEQNAGPLSAQPGTGVQPTHQFEVLGLLAEVAVAIAFANDGGVIPTGLTVAVEGQARVTGNAELCGDARNNGGGHIGRIGQEGAEEPGGDNLQSQAKAVVIAASVGQKLEIGVVEVEVAR
jgi:hypothetical protein